MRSAGAMTWKVATAAWTAIAEGGIRATCDDGSVIGAPSCRYGRIFLNAQAWAILSGIAGERDKRAWDAVVKHLSKECGPVLWRLLTANLTIRSAI